MASGVSACSAVAEPPSLTMAAMDRLPAGAPTGADQEPVLSHNISSSQLHTPKQLDRITIDDPQ